MVMLGLVAAICKSVEPILPYSGELCYVEKNAEFCRRGLEYASLSNGVPTE